MDTNLAVETFERLIAEMHYDFPSWEYGHEVAPGWFNLYNENNGQSRAVLFDLENNIVVKYLGTNNYSNWTPPTNSEYSAGKVLGEVRTSLGIMPIRLVTHAIVCGKIADYEISEYVPYNMPFCRKTHWGSCANYSECQRIRLAAENSTGLSDLHCGNWRVLDGAIVVIDWE